MQYSDTLVLNIRYCANDGFSICRYKNLKNKQLNCENQDPIFLKIQPTYESVDM
jgi:hypothetical protein